MTLRDPDLLNRFLAAALVPRDGSHASGTLAEAEALLAAHPDLAVGSIHAAAVLGDDAALRHHLASDPASATRAGGPYGWDPLTHLCFSRFLRLDRARSDGFLHTAERLLDDGASANTGWHDDNHQPVPEWESVLYGAAGIAQHPELTRLLLARGADPNDEEVVYHAPEGWDNDTLAVLLTSDALTPDSLATMLLRKHDWHDGPGVRMLLARGADPNRVTRWGRTALQQAILRDNALDIIEAVLDAGGDAAMEVAGRSATGIAARRGRGDVFAALAVRNHGVTLHGLDALLAACATQDGAAARALVTREPALLADLLAEGGTVLGEFAETGNTGGVRLLLELGVPVDERYGGDGYFGIAPASTALHVAAWRARHDTVLLLLSSGAAVNARDGEGRTALQLAVRAATDSYWSDLRAPDSIAALLAAGASVEGITIPTGYADADEMLRAAT